MPKKRNLTPEQRAELERASVLLVADLERRNAAINRAFKVFAADLEHLGAAIGPAIQAAMAEIEEYSIPEILYALRTTYGKPKRRKQRPPCLLKDLLDKDGRLPETVSMWIAMRYSHRSTRQIERFIAVKQIVAFGVKGSRRILVASLMKTYPPEK